VERRVPSKRAELTMPLVARRTMAAAQQRAAAQLLQAERSVLQRTDVRTTADPERASAEWAVLTAVRRHSVARALPGAGASERQALPR
jgi:hypothetical protein